MYKASTHLVSLIVLTIPSFCCTPPLPPFPFWFLLFHSVYWLLLLLLLSRSSGSGIGSGSGSLLGRGRGLLDSRSRGVGGGGRGTRGGGVVLAVVGAVGGKLGGAVLPLEADVLVDDQVARARVDGRADGEGDDDACI
jgi:hypothetical protein